MTHVLAVISAGDLTTQAALAAEALRKAADNLGHRIDIEVRSDLGIRNSISSKAASDAAALLLVGPGEHEESRFGTLKQSTATIEAVLEDADGVLAQAVQAAGSTTDSPQAASSGGQKHIVAITSCPTGIAHTFMAAEGVQKGAEALGYSARVETQGSVGSQNKLTDEEIAKADLVIIAADTQVDLSRFAGKPVFLSGTKPAINNGKALVERAFKEAEIQGGSQGLADRVAAGKAERAASRTGPYKHLMTGVSYMLPFVVAGGLLIAVAFAIGGIYAYENEGTLAYNLFQIGAKGGFALMVPALAGYIAYSIADRPGITPGMIGGLLAANVGAGFLGGIVAGFIAGYGTDFMNRHIKLHKNLEGLKPVLILPLLGTLLTGLLMMYVIGTPVAEIMTFLTNWLKSMQGSSAIMLGLIIGAMMGFDLGGPVNKAAYTFSTGLLASQVYTPMAAAMAAGMVPPLAVALATKLFADRFTADEREAGNAAAVLGIAFITEGAIPFAARDPLRVIPAMMVGAATTGAISMAIGAELKVPHGGIFVLPIPNAVTHLGGYIVALLVGTVVSALLLRLLKKPIAAAAPALAPAE
ncbi:PTS fructose transporter subunit IIC [Afifella marina]|uniref:protein-N(pi)-phosphohistidine--D-fructose phosphotransferase n=1 Tax=Afifella marina DSM 2698 TaxID=1120955 RepID=A0A1G5NUT3_AFIMA|nr:fructose-specific PTS transporter subunit EIIC [Afifella marina]MBK1624084.1 PTS fructose transporter subunit EIIBC [Afifella marina DSM 2698]MBK1627641.1 PTS fructose transporter subunit EIIBC [Afifella marina]MBK5916365.1 PTS fructose transporter subunit EIIBC [Afifella marina]RAI20925.1 PTS fructose transporter subunit EIIBC [Afifella marina DSM 2698]SCZ41004.1 PTS system, fructose-specific IIC component [Afifella marina DSM 2698]